MIPGNIKKTETVIKFFIRNFEHIKDIHYCLEDNTVLFIGQRKWVSSQQSMKFENKEAMINFLKEFTMQLYGHEDFENHYTRMVREKTPFEKMKEGELLKASQEASSINGILGTSYEGHDLYYMSKLKYERLLKKLHKKLRSCSV